MRGNLGKEASWKWMFRSWCGGSLSLEWLVGLNLGIGLLLAIAFLICLLARLPFDWAYSLLALPSSPEGFFTHPWTLGTYMVSQFHPLHLLFNLLWLVWFGRMLAETGKGSQIAPLYISGGIAGGLLYLIVSAASDSPAGAYLTGSSASVLTLMAVATLNNPNRRVNLFLFGEVKIKWVALVCILLTLIGADGGMGAGQAAHIGGLLTGLLFWIFQRYPLKFRKAKGKVRIDGRAAANRMRDLREMNIRLDELLDKVRTSGYDSLSKSEKKELDDLSRRIP